MILFRLFVAQFFSSPRFIQAPDSFKQDRSFSQRGLVASGKSSLCLHILSGWSGDICFSKASSTQGSTNDSYSPSRTRRTDLGNKEFCTQEPNRGPSSVRTFHRKTVLLVNNLHYDGQSGPIVQWTDLIFEERVNVIS